MDSSSSRPLAVVTGASSGIGLELARQLQERGHDIVICAEDAELAAVERDLSGPRGQVHAVRADLATRSGVTALVDAVEALSRPVEVLALNAGVGVGGPFVETALEDDLRLVELNVASTVHLAKRLVPGMAGRGRGRVLVTASIAAIMPGPWYATYAASKSFLHSFAEALRYELRDTGVSVTSLLPGPTDTQFFARAGMEDTKVGTGPKDDPADVARDALEALFDGEDQVISHSWRRKVMAAMKGAPDRLKAAQHARLTRRADGSDPDASPTR